MGRHKTPQDKIPNMGPQGLKHSSVIVLIYFVCIQNCKWSVTVIYGCPKGVKRSKCRRGGHGAASGEREPGAALPHPRQRAAPGGETGLWLLRGGEERRVAHAQRQSGETPFHKPFKRGTSRDSQPFNDEA